MDILIILALSKSAETHRSFSLVRIRLDILSLFPVSDWKAEKERLRTKNENGQYEEFCFVLESYIEMYKI